MTKRADIWPEPGKRRCATCGAVKPISEFVKANTPSGIGSACKPCKLEAKRELRRRMAGKPDPTIHERFWPKVDKNGPLWNGTPCWNWIGAKSNRGYGAIFYQGADSPAHRVSMQIHGHEVFYPAKVVDHMCKNIACVNPAHLRICTQIENTTIYADRSKMSERLSAAAAGRHAEGTKVKCACGREFWPAGMGRHRRVCPAAQRL